MIFKCKNCGGNAIYSPEKKMIVCPFCESENSYVRKDKETTYGLEVCPECGGTIPVEQYDSAMKCPYCDNSVIFNPRVEGEYLPKFVIPFELGKEHTKNLIRERFKKFKFAPADFLSEARLDSMQGVYVPFWFYDYKTRAIFEGEGTKVRSWTSGSYRYTETSYYAVVRDMSIPYEKLPADASIKMPDSIMDLMEPYDYTKLTDFQPEYLSGFNAEYYNMPAEEIENRAKQKMENSATQILKGTISGYTTLRETRKQIAVLDRNTDYGLMPVWRYVYEYQKKEYPFYVNGETGKIVGTAPLSKGKVWFYSATLWFLLTVLLASINGILGLI
ncbi:MAG: hypothetical protein J5546_04285 [Lachnospiraceae bacterium]|nr:hypothetical protein [Lachnospiraceae bacterium]